MPQFDYSALDANGRVHKAQITADSERAGKGALRSRGFIVLDFAVVASNSSEGQLFNHRNIFKTRLSGIELAMVLRQLSTLIESGLPLSESLRSMALNSESAKLRALIESWSTSLLEGESLAESMRNGTKSVDGRVTAAVAVAEQTGHLAQILERLADEQERAMDNRRAIRGALTYPLMLVSVALAAMIFVVTNIIPKITDVFVSQKSELPTTTRIVIKTSDFLQDYGVLIGSAAFLVTSVAAFLLRRPDVRTRFHRLLLLIPQIGYWIKLANFADWSRNLALMLAAGVPILNALRIANVTVTNLHIRSQLDQVVEAVRGGESLSTALLQVKEMSNFMTSLISSGEKSSRLMQMLDKIGAYYSKQLTSSTETTLKLLNPILLILIAGMILVIILGVITPIMQMNRMV